MTSRAPCLPWYVTEYRFRTEQNAALCRRKGNEMPNPKSYLRVLIGLMVAMLPALLQTGCKGDVGWARMDAARGRQSPSRSYQSGGLELVDSTSSAQTHMAVQEENPAFACGTMTHR